jgi:hypothetical protein
VQRVTPSPPRQRDYDLEEIERGLRAVALAGGNTRLASRRLRDLHGLAVPPSTLRRWIEATHSERYEVIRVEEAERVQRLAASEFEDLGRRSMVIVHKGLDRLEREMDQLPLRDVAGAVRNVGVVAGLSQSQVQVTRERPLVTKREHVRDLDEIFRALRAIDPRLVIDDEPPDAEVVEEPKVPPAIPPKTGASA